MHAWIWMKFCVLTVVGHGRTDQLLSPILIIVRMPEPENVKSVWNLKSVRQAPHSEQATSHGMHCREILFSPRCSPRAREFPQLAQRFCTMYGCRATGRQRCPILGFCPIFQYKMPKMYLPVTSRLQRLHRRMIAMFPCGSWRSKGVPSGSAKEIACDFW